VGIACIRQTERHNASHHRSPVKQGVLRAVSVGFKVLPGIRA